MAHHQKLYAVVPDVSNYKSDVYRDPGKDNTVWIFGVAALPMLAIPIILGCLGVVGWWLVGMMEVEMLLFGWLNDHIHDQFHLTQTIWQKVPAFRRWDACHLQHHFDMSCNFGIFGFGFDKVFGTFKNIESNNERD
jgi:sterol desaturase/sphingolipid hydroxylase (fatty acid hydroxylase superfamily)